MGEIIKGNKMDIEQKEFYILSMHTKQEDFAFSWWEKDSRGYTYCLDKAGKYTDKKHHALNSGDIMVPCHLVDDLKEYRYYPYDRIINIVKNTKDNRNIIGIKKSQLVDAVGAGKNNFLTREYVTAKHKEYKKAIALFKEK